MAYNIDLYYNQSTGNDANPGTATAPFQTFAALYQFCLKSFDLSAGYTITAHNSYAGTSTEPIVVSGRLVGQTSIDQFVIQGLGVGTSTVNPGAAGNPVSVLNGAWCKIDGFTLTNTTYNDHLMKVYLDARVYKGAVNFGAAKAGYFDMQAADGYILCVADWSTSGNKGGIAVSEGCGFIDLGFNGTRSYQVTFTGTPAYSLSAFNAGEVSYIDLGAVPTFSGTFTGAPWLVSACGEIGQNPAGLATLQACTSTPGIWKNPYASSVTAGFLGDPVYPGNSKILAVGSAGEAVASPVGTSLLTLTNNADSSLSIHSGSTSKGTLYFGRPGFNGNSMGAIQYDHNNETMAFVTGTNVIAAFDGAALNLASGKVFKINGTQVLGPQITGYGTPTNAVRTASFNGATATLLDTAKQVAQLIIDLKAHGILGA